MIRSSANIDPLTGAILLARGHGYIMHLAVALYGVHSQAPSDCMGFVDENGEFLTREEAFELAYNEGLVTQDKYGSRLFSEDIWDKIPMEFTVLPPTQKSKALASEALREYGRKQFAVEPQEIVREAREEARKNSYLEPYWKNHPLYEKIILSDEFTEKDALASVFGLELL